MDTGYYTIIGLLAVGIAYGLLKKKRAPARRSRSGWIGLLVLGMPCAGLLFAGATGNENLSWFFGLALMVALPLLLLFAIGSAVGGSQRRNEDEPK